MEESNGGTSAGDTQLACASCGKRASLQCPKCIELKLPRVNAAFCSQACFKAAWSTHKLVHTSVIQSPPKADTPEEQVVEALSRGWLYVINNGKSRTAQVPYFKWTGPLRPFPVSPRRLVPEHIARPEWADTGVPKRQLASDLQNRVEVSHLIQSQRETMNFHDNRRENFNVMSRSRHQNK